MKKLAITAIIALGVAAPTLASAMTDTIHNDTAAKIFAQLAAEAKNGEQ